jgi:predicted NUDIX family NTP pyrophosphohydrolase
MAIDEWSQPMSIDTTPGGDGDFSDLVDDGTGAIPRTDLDEDEQEAADELEVDQTELEELGLTLDDPHQPQDE